MHCHLCSTITSIGAIVNHVRLMHPDVELGATWPDGGLLVVDTTAMAWEAAA